MTIGFAFTGSHCTFEDALRALEEVRRRFGDAVPIFSKAAAETDTRFGPAAGIVSRAEAICGRPAIREIPEAEPIGPGRLCDALVVAPCTGNTLSKLARGVNDTPVTMAVKSQLRNARPVILAVSTNDGLGVSAESIARLLVRRDVYFVPFRQDDPEKKPRSLAADLSLLCPAVEAALEGRQLQPILAQAGKA